jgi:hypothetical protein
MWEFPQQYGLWTPAEISTALWLDAADASTITISTGGISEWRDKSGNSRHATQSNTTRRPTVSAGALNGYNVATFDGIDDGMTCGDALNVQDFIFFAVARTNSTTLEQNIFAKWLSPGDQREFIFRFRSTSSLGLFISHDGTSPNSTNLNTTTTAGTSWSILAALKIGTALTVSLNGVTNSGTASSSTVYNSTASLFIGLAEISPNVYEPLNGQIASGIITTQATASNMQKLEGWAAHNYGLTANLPAGHPYKITPPLA